MPTRREVLASLALTAFRPSAGAADREFAGRVEIWEEPHRLARESAEGYRLLLRNERRSKSLIIAPAVRHLSLSACKDFRQRVQAGAMLILETGVCFSPREEVQRQAEILNAVFDLGVLSPMPACRCEDHSNLYVAYSWPVRCSIRAFETITPVHGTASEIIARWHGEPVCVKKTIGQGVIVYLGSMLGPGLFAEEREAHTVGRTILRSL